METHEDIKSYIHDEVEASHSALLGQLSTLISSKLERSEKNQRELSEMQMSRIQNDILSQNTYKFKRKSCEDQYQFNSSVLGKMKEAESGLDHGELCSAKQKLLEGMELMNNRQKLVKLADSSELGWKVVDEYVSNPLAEDSEDEKRMNRAFNAANRKVKAEKKKREKRYRPYPTQPLASTGKGVRPGVCYNCYKPGHWAGECPEKKGKDAGKISTPRNDLKNCTGSIFEQMFNENFISGSLSEHSVFVDRNDACTSASQVCDTGKCSSDQVQSPVGRLKSSTKKWESSGASSYILKVINAGYGLPFKDIPESTFLRNNRSALDAPDFVKDEIKKLIDAKCISQVSVNEVYVVNPLTVATNRVGKQRLVLDCRYINPFLHLFKCKFEETNVARQMFKQGDFLFKFDLKGAYHHVMILEEHRKYLGFKWTSDGHDQYFVFNVLPFGLKTAGYIFTKLMREVTKYWRSQGHKIILYLDDGLGGESSYTEAKSVSEYIHASLKEFGFLIAEDKCSWEPCTYITWLGFIWDTQTGKLYISHDRVSRLLDSLNDILGVINETKRLFKVRQIARITGQLISMHLVLGHVIRLKTRELYKCIDMRIN
ncbi:hypothetical protein FSP39_020182 [Pinctada imbricata]|uniref:CCHC-type domain-containing protein n=1 Tax=Pinctada imbricata TaxID=66713 RepID=A0AA89BRL3_PINIB|nr:hypothetical protein FSP39_020182 [Pinctada imbricata]